MARFAKQITYERLRGLRPDARNPRISPRLLPKNGTDEDLFRYIARRHDALTVAESIAEFGYFPSEPLIVVKERGQTTLTVVEGNRRLTAMRGLTDAALRETFTNRQRWTAAANKADLSKDVKIPVILAESRDAARPLIGYRHVAGIQKWDAYPKARFVAQMVDEGLSFEEAGERAALSASATRALYRNHAILRQATESFRLNVNSVEDRFGVFTAALNRVAIRAFIKAPGRADVVPIEKEGAKRKQWPLPRDAKDQLETLIGWLFGSNEPDPVIEESRDLGRLAGVGHVPSSMKKRACVKVTDFVRLGASPLAAARALADTLQSSIRPRWAGQSAGGARGLNQGSGRPSLARPDIGTSSPERCEEGSGARGAVQVVDGRS